MEKKAVLLIIVAVVVILVAGFFAYSFLAASRVDNSHKLLFPFPKNTQLLKAPVSGIVLIKSIEFHVASGTPILAPISGTLSYTTVDNPVAPVYGGAAFVILQDDRNFTAHIYTYKGGVDSSLIGGHVVKGQVIGSVGQALPDNATTTGASLILIYKTVRDSYVNLSDSRSWEQGSVKW